MDRKKCKVRMCAARKFALIFSALTAACATQGAAHGSAVEAHRPRTPGLEGRTRRDVLSERSADSPEPIRSRRQKEPFTITVDPSVEVEFAMEDNGATLVGNSLQLSHSGETLHLDSEINGVITLRVVIDAPFVNGERVLRIMSYNSDGSIDIVIIKNGVVVEMTSDSQKLIPAE